MVAVEFVGASSDLLAEATAARHSTAAAYRSEFWAVIATAA